MHFYLFHAKVVDKLQKRKKKTKWRTNLFCLLVSLQHCRVLLSLCPGAGGISPAQPCWYTRTWELSPFPAPGHLQGQRSPSTPCWGCSSSVLFLDLPPQPLAPMPALSPLGQGVGPSRGSLKALGVEGVEMGIFYRSLWL